MWEHCNGALHNLPHAQQHIVESRVNDDIQAWYAQRHRVLPWDALHLMAPTVEHQLGLPLSTKQQWVESVDLAIAWKACHDFGDYLQEQWFMCSWVVHH